MASLRPRSLGANEARGLVWEGETLNSHRPSFLRRLGPALAVLTGLCVLGLVVPGVAQRSEYVISFDNVVVEGTGTSPDTPELAHREVIGLDAVVAQGHAALAGGVPPKLAVRSPGSLLPFEPGLGTENASFRQEGFLVESFWAQKTASREGSFKPSHFHPADLSTGFEAQHFAGSMICTGSSSGRSTASSSA